ncbi:hypothetical protein [Planctomicrobium sp. SH527]|uniref:hypothetical protein n=1 Tax=Planctomicrobium sp. SH527 TaxID=3448123 RepID=UPI003F5C18CC
MAFNITEEQKAQLEAARNAGRRTLIATTPDQDAYIKKAQEAETQQIPAGLKDSPPSSKRKH